MLDLYALQIFLTAVEAGSFSEAGRRLQMSQPAVSMQIRALEKQLGLDLFLRAGRNISLSEAGTTLVPMARDLVNRAALVKETMTALQGEVIGHLRLACSTTAGKYVLPRIIAGYVACYPGVMVACQVGSRGTALARLREGKAHLAITSLREPSKDLEYREFIKDSVVLIVPPDHPWAARKSITVPELAAGRFIRRELNSGTQQTVITVLTQYNMSFNDLPTVMVLGNSEAIYLAVSEGIGVAFVSHQAAAEGIKHGRVVAVPIEGLEIIQQLYMVRHTGYAPTTAQEAFWNFVFSSKCQHLLDSLVERTFQRQYEDEVDETPLV